jgi:hypothetical protein
LHTLSATGINDEIGTADISLLLHTSDAAGESGLTGSASITLLLHELEAGGNHGAEIDLLLHTIDAEGVAGGVGTADIALLAHTLSASSAAENFGVANIQLLTHIVDATGLVNAFGVLDAELALHTLDATGYSGNIGTADITLLVYDLSTVAFQPSTGTAELTLFVHSLESAGFASIAENYRGWVLNTRTNGLTEYAGFAFNSFAVLDGVYLAAGPTGIHVIGTQDLDGAAEINGRVRTGSTGFGSSFLKRVPRLYVTGEFADDTYFRTITEHDGERTYLLSANGLTGDQQRRVPVGKGPKSVKWQFEVENADGGDFRVSNMLVYPQELRRRIQ